MMRLALGVVFSLSCAAWSQTVEAPVDQAPGTGNQGVPGSAGRVSGAPSAGPSLRSPALKSAIPGGSSAPRVQVQASAQTASPSPVMQTPALAAPQMPEQQEVSQTGEVRQALSRPETSAPKEGKPSASSALGETVREIGKSRIEEGAGGSGAAVDESLRRVFDTARKAAGGAEGKPAAAVLGRFEDAEKRIEQTVRVANGASPHDAPSLYEAAVAAAKAAFSPNVSAAVSQAVKASANLKAETALPQLAGEAYGAARTGEAAAVEKAFKSLGLWERLLATPGRPLIENLSHLRADVMRVLSEPKEARAQASSNVVFERQGQDGIFVALLPSSSVSPLPKELAASFALLESPAYFSAQDELLRLFRRDPSAANGARLIYRAGREAGASAASSFWDAFLYWLKASFAWAKNAVFGGARTAAAEDEGAAGLLYARGSDWDLASARDLVARAKATAARYQAATGDDSPAQALLALERRLEKGASGMEPGDPLPGSLAALLVGEGPTVQHWVGRMRGDASDASPLLDPSDAALALDRRAAIESLLADVKRRSAAAARSAAAVQTLDPSPVRYATIGRTGNFLIQSAGRKTKSGKVMVFTVLRDREFGALAFARAAWAGAGPKALSPEEIAAP